MKRWPRVFLTVCLLVLLAACSAPATTPAVTTPRATEVVPTPTLTPTATATAAPTTAVTLPATDARTSLPAATANRRTAPVTATQPATSGGGLAVKDSDGRCQITLPTGWNEDAPDSGEFIAIDEQGFGLLTSVKSEPGLTLDTAARTYVGFFSALVAGYTETSTVMTGDSRRTDFTGELGTAGQGTFYFKQFSTTICALVIFTYHTSLLPHGPTSAATIGSLQTVNP